MSSSLNHWVNFSGSSCISAVICNNSEHGAKGARQGVCNRVKPSGVLVFLNCR